MERRQSTSRSKERAPRRNRNEEGRSFGARAPRKIVVAGELDYKNYNALIKFVTERGKIVSRRLSGLDAKGQRQLVEAIKIARFLGLLPVGNTQRRP